MTVGSSSPSGIKRVGDTSSEERAALEGMLQGYPVEQLVEEVLIAWDELAKRNDEMVSVKQRLRVLELDLAEREGYQVFVISLFDGGCTDEELLHRNTHGVPLQAIQGMRERFEHDWKNADPRNPHERG